MVVIYPPASQNAMSFDGPINPAFAVPGGRLLTNVARDADFPYIYEVKSHPLVSNPNLTTILVIKVDTSREARRQLFNRERTLFVPLGPDSSMAERGL